MQRLKAQLKELDAQVGDLRRDDEDLTTRLVAVENMLPKLLLGPMLLDGEEKDCPSQLPLRCCRRRPRRLRWLAWFGLMSLLRKRWQLWVPESCFAD